MSHFRNITFNGINEFGGIKSSWRKKLGAYLIDVCILGALYNVLIPLTFYLNNTAGMLTWYFLPLCYFTGFLILSNPATPGQRLIGLQVHQPLSIKSVCLNISRALIKFCIFEMILATGMVLVLGTDFLKQSQQVIPNWNNLEGRYNVSSPSIRFENEDKKNANDDFIGGDILNMDEYNNHQKEIQIYDVSGSMYRWRK